MNKWLPSMKSLIVSTQVDCKGSLGNRFKYNYFFKMVLLDAVHLFVIVL